MTVFIGRQDELGVLRDVVARARSGPSAAIIVGEPGSGKSRLLAEAQQRAAVRRRFAVVGYEPERQVPLAAAGSLLRALSEVQPYGQRLEAFLLRSIEATGLEPLRLFEAAHRAFRTMESTLLVIDDLHWMDHLSYALCHYLIRAAQETGQRVAIFAATRPAERGSELVEALPQGRRTTIQLAPLSLEEGIELALTIDPDIGRDRAREYWEAAKGSPFWIRSLARTSEAVGGFGQHLTVRLRGAGADVGALLRLLAVAGRPLSSTDAVELTGWPPDRLEAALHELMSRGVAIETAGGAHLTHDLLREAALADLPADSRRVTDRRLAEWLEARGGDSLSSLREALEHRRAAGMETLDLARRLARSPQRTLLGMPGLALLSGIADEADPDQPGVLDLLEDVATLATELAEHEEALVRWLIVAEHAGGTPRGAAALLAAATAAYSLARVAEARQLLERSREVESADAVLRLEQHTLEAAILLWLERRTAAGRALAREAVASATELAAAGGGVGALDLRTRRAYLEALRLAYEAAMQEGDREALLQTAQAREASSRGLDLETRLGSSVAVGGALTQNARVSEALARFRRVWRDAQRHILPRLAVDAGYWLARSLLYVGNLVEAEHVIGETEALVARAGDVPRARHRVALVACRIAVERGRPRDALRRFAHEASVEPTEHQRIAFLEDLAVWYARLDGPARATAVREQLAAGRASAQAVGCPRCTAELTLFGAEALARIGDRDEARRSLAEWDRLGIGTEALDGLIRLHVGALAAEHPADRASALEAAAAGADPGFPLQRLWIGLDHGRALAETGDTRAVEVLEVVAAAALARGAETVVELAHRTLRSLGRRTWRREGAGRPLTRREQEIGPLVAAGSTNREIAGALFLSPKTVERHISNMLRKLGARNRTELADRLREQPAKSAGFAR